MRLKLIVALAFMLVSSSVASIHPGLKAAIDNGEIKKAETLVKKMNIKDVYCPASLSWQQAKQIYGNYFKENPNEMYSICEPEFIASYDRVSCIKKDEIQLCVDILKKHPIAEWQPYLERIYKNKLQNGVEEYEAVEMVKERMAPSEKKGCLFGLTLPKNLLAQYERDFKRNMREAQSDAAGILVSSLLGPMLQFTIDSLKKDIRKKEQLCNAGLKEVEKTVKKTRPKNYFVSSLHELYLFLSGSMSQPFGWDENTKKLYELYIKLSGKDSEWPKEQNVIDMLTNVYSKEGDFDDSYLLAACRLYPKIDRNFERKIGINLFSCPETIRKYSMKCDEQNYGEEVNIPTSINGQKTVSYRCDGEKWYTLTALESDLGVCDEKKYLEKHAYEGKLYGCLNNMWTELTVVEFATVGERCDNESEGKTISHKGSNLVFTCKNGMWEYGMIDVNNAVVPSSLIGGFVWNLENVNINMPKAFCPINDEAMCGRYSRLYYYAGAKKACPEGWKVPTADQVENLKVSLLDWREKGNGYFGKYPGALRDESGNDREAKEMNLFWVMEENGPRKAAYVALKNNGENIDFWDGNVDSYGLPLRCVLDVSDPSVFTKGFVVKTPEAKKKKEELAKPAATKRKKENDESNAAESANPVVKIASIKSIVIESEGVSGFMDENDFSSFLKDRKKDILQIYTEFIESGKDIETAIKFYLVVNTKSGKIEEVQNHSAKEEKSNRLHKALFRRISDYMQSEWSFEKTKKKGTATIEFPIKFAKE